MVYTAEFTIDNRVKITSDTMCRAFISTIHRSQRNDIEKKEFPLLSCSFICDAYYGKTPTFLRVYILEKDIPKQCRHGSRIDLFAEDLSSSFDVNVKQMWIMPYEIEESAVLIGNGNIDLNKIVHADCNVVKVIIYIDNEHWCYPVNRDDLDFNTEEADNETYVVVNARDDVTTQTYRCTYDNGDNDDDEDMDEETVVARAAQSFSMPVGRLTKQQIIDRITNMKDVLTCGKCCWLMYESEILFPPTLLRHFTKIPSSALADVMNLVSECILVS